MPNVSTDGRRSHSRPTGRLGYLVAGLIAVLWACAGASAAPLALSDVPLGVSTSVEPNVMLLVDNSGSMNNIIWANGFSQDNSYEDWGGNGRLWQSGNSNIILSDLYYNYWNGRYGADYVYVHGQRNLVVRGYRNGSWKQLYLPDPVGNLATRYTSQYLDYLFSTYPSDTDLTQGQIPDDYRMNVARNTADQIVENTPGVRFGLSTFNPPGYFDAGPGGQILAGAGAQSNTQLVDDINRLTATANTPLAETDYEITRYFRGLSSYYNRGTSYTSPLQYRCQKNFTIVITDGLPTYDTSFPSNDPDDPDHKLPDWDGKHPATGGPPLSNPPPYSDGFQPSGNPGDEGYSLYLDDIADFAWDTDLKTSGTDDAGKSWNDPAFPKQNIYTYTVGFATNNQMLEDAAHYGHGQYYTADNAQQLSAALNSALANIISKTNSAAAAVSNTGSIQSGARVYQGRYNSINWSGQLLAFDINTDSTSSNYGQLDKSGSGPDGALWDAGNKIPAANNRTIFTDKDGSGIPFTWSDLSQAQQSAIGSQAILKYVRGDPSQEQRNGGSFRNRSTLLGDIVHSSPVYVGAPDFNYPDNWGSNAPENSAPYSTFVANHENRTPMLYVGANDGMLHGFNANTGVEQFDYVPTSVFGHLKDLTNPDYSHKYYVDGSPTAIDAFFGNAWHTVLTGGLRKGGQGIYALDVTDPTNPQLLWEFTDADDPDLGYTYSRPAVVRMHNGEWAVVFGNGYDNTAADGHASTTGHAVLYIAFISEGTDGTWSSSDFVKIDTDAGTPQTPDGLATVAPVDLNDDHVVDAIYAGDLQGNLWKFDVSSSNPSQWQIAYGSKNHPEPLFTTPNGQPITTRPEVGPAPGVGVDMVYFGTGKYLETADNNTATPVTQSFYGIVDDGQDKGNDTKPISGQSALLQQKIVAETSSPGNAQARVTTNYDLGANDKGWYINLVPPSGVPQGERVVSNPVLRGGRIIFTTLTPDSDPCTAGGTSWLMELNAFDGSRLGSSPFDFTNDGQFTNADNIQTTIDGKQVAVPASGMKLSVGNAATPTITAAQNGLEFKYISGGGGLQPVRENATPQDTGRQAWLQLTN